MKYTIDLTKKNFNRIDFSEAMIIDFYCQQILPNRLEFKVWGATLLLSSIWENFVEVDAFLQNTNDMYVSGLGIVKIDNLIGGNIIVYAYDNIKNKDNITVCAKNCDGSNLIFEKKWEYETTEKYDEYLWECVIEWPYGYCNLCLISKNGNIIYEFDTDNIVTGKDYIMNPSLYGFNKL